MDLAPMKAEPGELPTDDGTWWFEVKWDGMRVLAQVGDGGDDVRLRGGRRVDVTAAFPEVVAALPDAVGGVDCLLDGEVVVMDDAGVPSFELLQQRMHVTDLTEARRRAASTPVSYLVFDLLRLDGADLVDLAYTRRRELLEGLVLAGPVVQVPAAFPTGGAALLDAARERGLEGVVAKRADSRYEPGRRSRAWRKVKVRNTQELVVVGWLGGTGARERTLGSLVLACRRDGELTWAGNVGSGLTAEEVRVLTAALAPLSVDACPLPVRPAAPTGVRARWVRPELVVQVSFGEWTSAGRLRHPVYLGRRVDVAADDVTCDP